ncbi:sensor histidine kinase [Hansschlegelia sp. KR7-227]|uniref:sensor histidine kinase n=1 Tax=Hansschlegelia sp. KR7-227 TaxID=3400914 RepID=UPI003BFAC5A5
MSESESAAPPAIVRDPERLVALASYGILDTSAEEGFDDIVTVACEICQAPVALVSFVAADRQWFKARVGFEGCQTPLEQSVCAHALLEPEILVVPDLTKDRRTRGNTLVTHDPFVRFYAGVVLRTPEGQPLGTLCVLDVAPRPNGLTAGQRGALLALGRQVMAMLALRRVLAKSGDELAEQAQILLRRAEAAAKAQERELRLRLAIDATQIGIFDYDLVAGRLDWDARTRELFGVPPDAPVTYEASFLNRLHPDDRVAADRAVRASLDASGSGIFEQEYRTVGPHGDAARWIAARGIATFADGEATRLVGTVRDVTARRSAAAAVSATLDRYRLVGRMTKDVIWDWDLATGAVLWNDALTVAYGYLLEEVDPAPQWWVDRIHPDDRARTFEDIRTVIEGPGHEWQHEYRFRRADGLYADVLDRGSVIRDEKGRPLRMIGAMLDNTERKAEEERQRLLNLELSHRMKNLLAMVQALAAQTLRSAGGLEEAREKLFSRLVALSKAHDILLAGSANAAQLSSIVARAVELIADRPDRVSTDGPDLEVGSRAALPLMLMMHELGANAAKYGALSNASGRVAVSWRVTGERGAETVRLTWSESGGPAVVAPTRQGFGSKLLERGLARQLGATTRLTFPADGATCEIVAPLDRLAASD